MALHRIELKYYINYIDYVNLGNRISSFFSNDRNSTKNGCYHVRSLYFDNKSDNHYFEKIEGIEKRKKYRIRIYNQSYKLTKLEIKNKINNIIFKESIVIKSEDVNAIIAGDYRCLLHYADSVTNKIYCEFSKDYYKPVVIIDYIRKAYSLDLNNIRITFDSKVEKNEINFNNIFKKNINMSPVLKNNKIIMEIKYDSNIPNWIKNLLQLSRFERCALSKYTLSRCI